MKTIASGRMPVASTASSVRARFAAVSKRPPSSAFAGEQVRVAHVQQGAPRGRVLTELHGDGRAHPAGCSGDASAPGGVVETMASA